MQNKVQEWIYRLQERILYTWETIIDPFVKIQAVVEIQVVLEVAPEVVLSIVEISVRITPACPLPAGTIVS